LSSTFRPILFVFRREALLGEIADHRLRGSIIDLVSFIDSSTQGRSHHKGGGGQGPAPPDVVVKPLRHIGIRKAS
jgi:hypothetical protein